MFVIIITEDRTAYVCKDMKQVAKIIEVHPCTVSRNCKARDIWYTSSYVIYFKPELHTKSPRGRK